MIKKKIKIINIDIIKIFMIFWLFYFQENGEEIERDLVEFVAFSKFNEDIDGLSSEVLKEIPTSVNTDTHILNNTN